MELKRLVQAMVFTFLIIALLGGCRNGFADGSGTIEASRGLFQYKNAYVGDNSAVGNILNGLPHSGQLAQISLKTKARPYQITAMYNDADHPLSDEEEKDMVISNSAYLFALVKNVDQVAIVFKTQDYEVIRDQLQEWIGKDLRQVANEHDLKTLLNHALADRDNVDRFIGGKLNAGT